MLGKSLKSLLLLTGLICLAGGVSADSVKLINGDVINGKVLEETDAIVRLEHPDLGPISIPREKIDTLTPAFVALDSGATIDPDQNTIDWKRKVGFGLFGSGSSGNSVNNNVHLEFSAEYENIWERWISKLAYDLQSTDSEISQNKFFAQLDRDWLMPDSQWFWFARGRFDWDKFKEWETKVTGIVGPGYQFIENEIWNLRGRTGIGGSYTWGGPDEGSAPEAQAALDLTWKLAENQSIDAASTFYVSLKRADEYKNITSLDWHIDIDSLYEGMAVKFGVYNEYESNTAEDVESSDFKYRFSVLVGL